MWEFLLQAQLLFPLPWCLGGDFNIVLKQEERVGVGNNSSTIRTFNDFIRRAKLDEKALMKEISNGWSRLQCSGSTSRRLSSKIKAAKLMMKRWYQSYKKNSFSVDKCEKMLGEIEKRAEVEGWSCRLRNSRLQLLSKGWRSLRKEEQTWRQKSRVRWLKEGDKNTKFFHLLANDRKRRNFIKDITVEGELSKEEKVKLEGNFSIEEAWEALCSCDGNKAPGPDGLNLNFIKENWVVIREDFLKFLKEFFKDGSIVKELNNTFIALIPKVSKPTTLKEFRPISLVGSKYKILAKILANRIKKVMNSVIGENQMAFIQNRQLVDSYVIAKEIIQNWRKEMEGGLIVKIDFEKAYDSVDFQFLDTMMEGMGFGYRWRQWIRCCISTPAMSILVNGSPTPQFKIERGLRQGDLLSPFLFNIVTEGLSALMNKATNLGLLQGASVGNNEVHLSHLQFADDTIFFLKPKIESLFNLKRLIRCYELSSGLKINFHKTCIVRVSKNVRKDHSWAATLKCRSATLPLTYLGLPLGARPGLKAFWNPVVKKVEDQLALWKRRFLSKEGRLVLIKLVLSSIATYYMSVFKMPVGVAQKIEKLQRNFLCRDGIEKRKLHAVDWISVCKSKAKGGLGIGRMIDKNEGLLAKWVWRFGREESPLWKKVLCAKYVVKGSEALWNWQSNVAISFLVKTIANLFKLGTKSAILIKEGFKVVIGCGDKAELWNDIKVGERPLKEVFPRMYALAVEKEGQVKKFDVKPAIRRVSTAWLPPALNTLKFNVDESALGKPGPAGIGGVLRDFKGNVLCSFSLFIGVHESNTMEIKAIQKACALCVYNSSLIGRKIKVISDSKDCGFLG
ncbi:hypothetical protein Dsin_014090 [Dipteronia sinensis]|uniref:Reverse transcriptase domain-containing protein n=1 Tax=Dipteronia sinensis TaxID=43782 RepID=A0AAE0EB88_9ROSI|nr:hypothetical protein Dsin_014090 [Dipteronia sinensis]